MESLSELKTEFKYDLIQSFEYASQGELKKATFLTVKMPTGRLTEYTSIIDQEFQKAAAYLENNFSNLLSSDKQKENSEGNQESYTVISKVLAAGNSDLNKCYKALKNILSFKIGKYAFCLIDEETSFETTNFDSMSIKDINNVLGGFIESFL